MKQKLPPMRILLNKTREAAHKAGLKKDTVARAIKEVREEANRRRGNKCN